MSYYYKYQFVSPEPIYSLVKEEFKSYFDTGAVDDLLFPTYLDKCLKKLGRSSFVIAETALFIEDFQARLPDNFYAVREAWMCAEIPLLPYQEASSFYSQASSCTTIQIAPVTYNGTPCTNVDCQDANCPTCMPEIIQAVYKTNNQVARSYKQSYLLKPGNISARNNCSVDYTDTWELYSQPFPPLNENIPGASSYDSFDIRDNKFVTNFRSGIVHLVFYATDYDESGNQLVPDNYRIKEYVEAFIKYKVMEMLTNQTMDETYNQLREKKMDYMQQSDQAYIMAETEIKKQDAYTKVRRIKQQLNKFNKYQLPNQIVRRSYRR